VSEGERQADAAPLAFERTNRPSAAMSKPFDATLKALLEESPRDWPALAGFLTNRAEVVDADVSTVSGAADKVLRVRGSPDWIMHLDFQAGPDAIVPRRTHGYNALLEDRHELMVRSVVVLLRPEANLRAIKGTYERQFPGESTPYLTFRYQVIRVWEIPAERLLAGGLGTLPLAPISRVTAAEVPEVIRRMRERLGQRRYRHRAAKLWTATYVLMGLRHDEAFTDRLFQEVIAMEESVTYQAIITRGRREEARKILLELGKERFRTAAPAHVQAALQAIDELPRLEELTRRLLSVESWEELLQSPPPRPRKRKQTS
jgi:predicted transposase YdaD